MIIVHMGVIGHYLFVSNQQSHWGSHERLSLKKRLPPGSLQASEIFTSGTEGKKFILIETEECLG